jgi:HSF-type DNA-binding
MQPTPENSSLRLEQSDNDTDGCLQQSPQPYQTSVMRPSATFVPREDALETVLNDSQQERYDQHYQTTYASWADWNFPLNAFDPIGYQYQVSYHPTFPHDEGSFQRMQQPPTFANYNTPHATQALAGEYEPLSIDMQQLPLEDAKICVESVMDSKPYIIQLNSTDQSTSSPVAKTFPSERADLDLSNRPGSAEEASRMLQVLGSTLRSKADQFIDTSTIPVPRSQLDNYSTTDLFPDRLYKMLTEAEKQGWTEMVSFQPHGRSFRVHNKQLFVKKMLPMLLKGQGSWSSFLRQLRLYGFSRTKSGPDYGAYYHELFLRSRPDLCQ